MAHEAVITLHRIGGKIHCSRLNFDRREELAVGAKIQILSPVGTIEIRNTKKARLHAVYLDSRGNFVCACDLNHDGTFNFHRRRGKGGYRYWFSKAPETGLQRVVLARGLPRGILKQVNGRPIELSLERDALGKYEYVVTDGQVQNVHVPTNGDPRKTFVHEGTYAIVVSESGTWTRDLGYGGEELKRWFERIYVRDNCDPLVLNAAVEAVRAKTAALR